MVADNGYLFASQYGDLWRENLGSGYVAPFGYHPGASWYGTEAMTAYGNYLYAVKDGTLWREDLNSGQVGTFGESEWPLCKAPAGRGRMLFDK